jgi:hypothetical protein
MDFMSCSYPLHRKGWFDLIRDGYRKEVIRMAFPKVRRVVITATLAGGTLIAGAFGVQHALAATKATPTPSQSQRSGSTTHHCPNDANGNSSATTSAFGY